MRSVDFAEADRILTFLTPGAGLVGVMARGARSSRRRFGGALEPFAITQIEFVRGRGDLGRLQQAQIAVAFPGILSDLGRMRCAGAALEVARSLSAPEVQDPAAFDTSHALLQALDGADPQHAVRLGVGYRARLLAVCGFEPRLDACGRCGRHPGSSQPAWFDPLAGHLVCSGCGGAAHLLSARSRGLIGALCGASWLDAVAVDWSEQVMDETAEAIEAMTRHRIGAKRA